MSAKDSLWCVSLVVALATGCGAEAARQDEAVEADRLESRRACSRAAARFEIRFMESMIDHHAMAVHMAEMCVEHAVHEELRAMCGEMITAQTAEIESMQAWLLDWYGITAEPDHMGMDQMGMHGDHGEEFEIMFLRMMIRHHATAVRDGSRCLYRAEHDELLDLCGDIVTTQSEEIQTMRGWLCDWYGRCR